ncbi:MAG: hypothetical protein J7K40_11240 [candidate division Zixibacteria bacterium]|nr:hypothetical protein [candidate division Zixibacteria bacterium]
MKQPEFTVHIDANAWAKFQHWVGLANQDEVSALGLIDEVKNNGRTTGLFVSEIYLVEQTVNGAETTLDDKAVANLMIQLATEEIDGSRLKCWIHSHAGMTAFWSTTDDECCAILANGSYSVSIVTNIRGDILTRLDVYHPCHLILDKVLTQIHYPCSKELEELYTAEFEAKVNKTGIVVKKNDRFVPTMDFTCEEELELAFEQGTINMEEYQQLSGYSIFDDL